MEKQQPRLSRVIVVALLTGVTVFCVFQYVAILKEKYDLLNSITEVKNQATVLEAEKQNLQQVLEKEKQLGQQLSQENARLTEGMRASEDRIAKLNTGFVQAQKEIEDLNAQISIMKTENLAFQNDNDLLKFQVNQAMQERDALKTKLSSLAELKKAIKELKIHMRQVRRNTFVPERPEVMAQTVGPMVVEGNRGFLIKHGKPTYPTKVKIEVNPLPEEAQQ